MRKHAIHINLRLLLSTFLLLSYGSSLDAQLKYAEFHKLSKQNGLSSDIANSIIRDRDGIYWIATADGVNRFDGTSFRIFRYDKKDTASINHNLCMTVLEGLDGDIWVGTQKGLCRYQKKTGRFRRYYFHHPKFNDDIINPVYKLMMDKDGNIWTANYGLWKVNPFTHEIKSFNYEDKPTFLSDASQTWNAEYDMMLNGIWVNTAYELNFFSISENIFYNMANNPFQWKVFDPGRKNPFITCHNGMLWLYDEPQRQFYSFNADGNRLEKLKISINSKVAGISNDQRGNILIRFFSLHAVIFHTETASTDTLPAIPELNFNYKGSDVLSFYTDHNGNRWFCTNKGVLVARNQESGVTVQDLNKDHPGIYSLHRIACINDSIQFIGTARGLLHHNSVSRSVYTVTNREFQHYITALLYNGDDVLWIATAEPALIQYDIQKRKIIKKQAVPTMILFLIRDKYENIWAGSWDEGLFEFDKAGNITRHYTEGKDFSHKGYFLGGYYDGADELWMGLNGGNGFAKLNVKTKQFEHFKIRTGDGNDFGHNSVNALLKDSLGNIWLGTYGSGVYLFNRSTGSFKNFSRSDGIAGDFINSLRIDKKGNLWVSSNNGVDLLRLSDTTIGHLSTKVEFDNNDFVNNLATYNDRLYYISGKRLTIVDPAVFSGSKKDAPVIISHLTVSGKEMGELQGKALHLNYNDNSFTIEFSVLKVSPDIPAGYRYKLEGFDLRWNDAGSRGIANYTNVPPGKYTLLLNATNESGIWNDIPLQISIIIKPPFWKTWWFIILALLAAVSIIAVIVRYRFRLIRAAQKKQLALVVETQEKEKRNIASQLHDDLGVRLSALKYFVTSLKQYLQPGNETAKEIHSKTIEAIDESVEDIRYLLVNLSPKTLNEYGYLVAVEDLLNKLQHLRVIKVELKQSGMEKRLPASLESGLYRVTQELVNNTLKHAKAQTIKLVIENNDGIIRLSYLDDGNGFELTGNAKGYGLENIQTRVLLLNGKMEWIYSGNKINGVNITVPVPHT